MTTGTDVPRCPHPPAWRQPLARPLGGEFTLVGLTSRSTMRPTRAGDTRQAASRSPKDPPRTAAEGTLGSPLAFRGREAPSLRLPFQFNGVQVKTGRAGYDPRAHSGDARRNPIRLRVARQGARMPFWRLCSRDMEGFMHSTEIWAFRASSGLGADPLERLDLTGYGVEALDGSIGKVERPPTRSVQARSWLTPARGSLARRWLSRLGS